MSDGDYQQLDPCGCTKGRTTHADGMVSTGFTMCEEHSEAFGHSRLDDAAFPTHKINDWHPNLPTEPLPPKAPMPWTYDGADPALMLFTAALERFRMTFPSGSRILELGCAESDWLERMHAIDPSYELVGVDARPQNRPDEGFALLVGSALHRNLFPEASFDRIVLLGALEHFGLGFYGDPEDSAGDSVTMANVAHWLRPGGFVYFDVPCQPTFRIQENRHFRSYSPASVGERLLPAGLQEINRAYSLSEPHAGTWCHEPTVERVPYWFVAVLAQKAA